jgi:hypothetical protein
LAFQQKARKPEIMIRATWPRMLKEIFAMTDLTHKFRIGQTVELIQSSIRSAARGGYEIVSLRPPDGGDPKYGIKSRSENHQRVVSETDLVLASRNDSIFARRGERHS